MKFQLRRFLDSVPWADGGIVLGALLLIAGIIYAVEHSESKKHRCPTCNQVVKEAK